MIIKANIVAAGVGKCPRYEDDCGSDRGACLEGHGMTMAGVEMRRSARMAASATPTDLAATRKERVH
jgi:hypothetical protein